MNAADMVDGPGIEVPCWRFDCRRYEMRDAQAQSLLSTSGSKISSCRCYSEYSYFVESTRLLSCNFSEARAH